MLKKAVQHKKKKLGLDTEKKLLLSAESKLGLTAEKNLSLTEDKKDSTSINALPPMSTTAADDLAPVFRAARSTKLNADKNKSAQKPAPQRKPLPVPVKKFLWKKADAYCEYFDPKIGTRCQSKFALQPDHIIPLALGGTNEISNLQLLCRVHNSRRAVKTFGIRRI